MEQYLDFTIEQEYDNNVLKNGLFIHRQACTSKTRLQVNAIAKSYTEIEEVLASIEYEYKEFLKRVKKDITCQFNLNISVGIYNKVILMRQGFYNQYGSLTEYYKRNMEAEQLTHRDITLLSVTEVLDRIKRELKEFTQYAIAYDKE